MKEKINKNNNRNIEGMLAVFTSTKATQIPYTADTGSAGDDSCTGSQDRLDSIALHIALLCRIVEDDESNKKYQVYLMDVQKKEQQQYGTVKNLSALLLQENNKSAVYEGKKYVEYQQKNYESFVQLLIKERVKHGVSRTVSSWKLIGVDDAAALPFLPLAFNTYDSVFGLFQLLGNIVNESIRKNEKLEQERDMVRASMQEWKTTAESLSKKYWKDRENELLENFVELLNQKKAEILKLKCELSAEKERKQTVQPQPVVLKRPLKILHDGTEEGKDLPTWDLGDIDDLAHGRRVSRAKKGRTSIQLQVPTKMSKIDDFEPRTNPLTGVKELSSAKQAFENDDDNSVASNPLL